MSKEAKIIFFNDELRQKKAEKLLERPFEVETEDIDEEEVLELRQDVVSGVEIKAESVNFVREKQSRREFMVKPETPPEKYYGEILVRTLSDKKYALKRVGFYKKTEEGIFSLIKWDRKIVGNYFLSKDFSEFFDKKFDLKHENIMSLARLLGVTFVFGEYDHERNNYFISKKTGLAVKIDNSFLTNGCLDCYNEDIDKGKLRNRGINPFARTYIYGSQAAREFFCHFLAGCNMDVFKEGYDQFREEDKERGIKGGAYEKARSDFKKHKKHDIYFEDIFKIFNNHCAAGVGDESLDGIKENLQQNAHLQPYFIEFMKGVEDVIELSSNQKLLDALKEKYRVELGEDAAKIALTYERILKSNAERAKEEFAKTIEFYHELEEKTKIQEKKLSACQGELSELLKEKESTSKEEKESRRKLPKIPKPKAPEKREGSGRRLPKLPRKRRDVGDKNPKPPTTPKPKAKNPKTRRVKAAEEAQH